MSLFVDGPARRPGPGRRDPASIGRWLLTGVAALALGISFLPAPYVIEQPGPVWDTLAEVTVEDESVPLISIPGEETFPTEGSLSMLTVNVIGNREQHPGWVDVIAAWADPSKAVVPVDRVYPRGQTIEESNEQGEVDMQNSQKEAVAASLTELGYEFDSSLTVAGLAEGGPADGILADGDVIEALDGQVPVDLTDVRSIIAAKGAGSAISLDVTRAGAPLTVEVTPEVTPESGGLPVMGIFVGSDFDFPFEVDIQLENVGGPSAGMMFALGIIDKLTPGALTGGADVAGTGTITAAGVVGPIGGVRQKMYGAVDAGASWFLAPADNCDEVVGHVPDGLRVFAVATLDDALAALEAVSAGEATDSLPDCTTA